MLQFRVVKRPPFRPSMSERHCTRQIVTLKGRLPLRNLTLKSQQLSLSFRHPRHSSLNERVYKRIQNKLRYRLSNSLIKVPWLRTPTRLRGYKTFSQVYCNENSNARQRRNILDSLPACRSSHTAESLHCPENLQPISIKLIS